MTEQPTPSKLATPLTRRTSRAILFALALMAWLGALTYLALSYQNPNLPANWKIFGILIGSINLFIIPALILAIPKDPRSPRRILIASWFVIIGVYWIFSPLYEFLALYETTRPGLRLLITNYIWEMPIIGFVVIYFLYHHFLKAIRHLESARQPGGVSFENARRRLMRFPLIALWTMIAIALVGDLIGLPIARRQLMVPWREIIKEFINLTTVGFLGGILFFFILGQLIRPWLEDGSPPASQKSNRSKI